jgi:hypothetical protein
MSKGSKPAGTVTSTATNSAGLAQEPYLKEMWGQAQDLYKNNPMQYYPGQTLTQWGTPEKMAGLWDQYRAGDTLGAMQGGVNNAYNTALTGGYGAANNQANQFYQGFANGTGYPQQNFQNLQDQSRVGGITNAQLIGQFSDPVSQFAAAASGNNNLGLSQLGNTASGAYLNSNPYINAAIQAAQDPVTRNYQTAVAPQTDAMFSGGGRYGSGAMAGAVSTGQQNLARGLGDISSNMMNANYARERQAQDTAAGQYGQLYNAGIGLGMQGMGQAANIQQQAGNQWFQGQSAAQNAAQQYAQGAQYGATGLNAMFNAGNQASQNALSMYPQFAQAQLIGPQAKTAAGTGMAAVDQATLADQMARFYGQQNAPYENLSKYSGYIGQPIAAQTSSSQPYFQNQGAEVLSGLTGIAGLGKSMFGKI